MNKTSQAFYEFVEKASAEYQKRESKDGEAELLAIAQKYQKMENALKAIAETNGDNAMAEEALAFDPLT